MSITIVEQNPLKIRGTVTIKPYFDENKENMGLEKYGLSLYDGVFHEEQLACIEMNGIKKKKETIIPTPIPFNKSENCIAITVITKGRNWLQPNLYIDLNKETFANL